MNIQDVIDSLDQTISEKQKLLVNLKWNGSPTMAKVLQINIDELNRIREDLIKVRDANPHSGIVGQPQ